MSEEEGKGEEKRKIGERCVCRNKSGTSKGELRKIVLVGKEGERK